MFLIDEISFAKLRSATAISDDWEDKVELTDGMLGGIFSVFIKSGGTKFCLPSTYVFPM